MDRAKAWVAAAIALLGTVGTALEDGQIEFAEVGIIVAAVLVAWAAVFQTPNKPA